MGMGFWFWLLGCLVVCLLGCEVDREGGRKGREEG